MEISRRSPLLLFLLFLFLSSGLLHCFAQSLDEVDELEQLENDSWDDENELPVWNQQDPARRQYQQCQQRCQKQGERQQQCQRACRRQFQRQQCQQQCQGRRPQERQQCVQRCQQRTRQQQQQQPEYSLPGENRRGKSSNPYYFDLQSFLYRFQSSEGHFRVLPRLTDVNPELFEALRNYRLAVFVARPHTFVQPHYLDATSVLVVLQGRGTVSLVCQEGSVSFNAERGLVLRVPAGVLVHISNPDSNQELHIAKLIQPVFTPGRFEAYFITENVKSPVSVLGAFSQEVLESSQKTPVQEIHRILRGQTQRQQVIHKASPEQLRQLSEKASSASRQETPERIRPFNLLKQEPVFSNNWGQFYEARPARHTQLQDLDVSISIVQMKQGSVFVPHYNSKASVFVLVTRGRVRFEMICPHVSRQSESRGESSEEEEGGEQLHRIVAEVSAGEAFLVPAGHALAMIAHDDTEAVGFGIRAQNNERNFIAGQNNIINKMDDAAKALTFGQQEVESVKRIFKSNPDESFFVPRQRQGQQGQEGQQEQRGGGGRQRLWSILDMIE